MNRHTEAPPEPQVELENQFVLRLPPEPAKALRETLRSGAMNLKDRLSIRLEPDMRYGEVRLDHWLLHAKLMDLPSILESLKTIDNKSFYKAADICQILICTEEEEPVQPEDDPPKQRKKDPNKVDKKYLWPHGIAPPLKNVRRRRFRKTLKKKFVEAPEIEKEVKRLLRVDNDAVAVKWEIISEEALAGTSGAGEGTSVGGVDDAGEGTSRGTEKSKVHRTIGGAEQLPENADSSLLDVSNQQSADVAEHEIFGEAVSDSDADVDTNSEDDDEDDGGRRIDVLTLEDEDESSRLMMSAGEESRMSADNSSPSVLNRSNSSTLVTQFSREMFLSSKAGDSLSSSPIDHSQPVSRYQPGSSSMDREAIRDRLAVLEQELADLRTKKEQREQQETAGDIENVALRQRFSLMLDEMITSKELEIEQLYDQMG